MKYQSNNLYYLYRYDDIPSKVKIGYIMKRISNPTLHIGEYNYDRLVVSIAYITNWLVVSIGYITYIEDYCSSPNSINNLVE